MLRLAVAQTGFTMWPIIDTTAWSNALDVSQGCVSAL